MSTGDGRPVAMPPPYGRGFAIHGIRLVMRHWLEDTQQLLDGNQ